MDVTTEFIRALNDDIPQRQRPKLQRRLNRAPAIHDLPNHGGPSIQKFRENATVVLSKLDFHNRLAVLPYEQLLNSPVLRLRLSMQFSLRPNL